MKADNLKVKNLLKLRTPQQITKDIIELSAVKSAYNHFLASYESMQMPDACAEIKKNLSTIFESLKQLYAELAVIKGCIKNIVVPVELPNNNEEAETLKQLNDRAIMLFNSDRRFTITE